MKRLGHYPVILLLICGTPSLTRAGIIVSAQSGNWGSSSTWAGGQVPTSSDSVTILAGDTVTVESSGKLCCNLTVEAGARLYANNSSTASNSRYLYIYGNIQCDGTIGNGSTYDLIAFNVEGDTCRISGSGHFDASRIRKYLSDSDTTTLIISRPVNLRFGGTALYNNKSGTVFRIIIESGDTLNVMGDGTTAGNVAIDGVNGGASSTGGGSINAEGTLIVSGILYMTNSNSSNPVSIIISSGGTIETASISCLNSGSSGHTFTIENGGTLNLTSGDWGAIGTTNNTYTFQPGSTVIYSGDTAQTVGNPAPYHHLTLSGGGTKQLLNDLTIGGNLMIEDGPVLSVDAGRSVTVSGACGLNGVNCLLLKSPADSSATASFIPLGGVAGTGTAMVERYIKKYLDPDDARYHMISSPVVSQEIQPEFVAEPPEAETDFYRWGEPEGTWINSKHSTGGWNTGFQPGDDRTFHAGRGYLVAYPEDQVKHFTGILNSGDLNPVITFTSGNFEGFNLVGNPYPSALTAEIGNWVKSNVGNAVWVWDGEAGNYKSWNGNVGTLSGGIIPAIQGFFVQALGPDPSLTIPASSRVHASQPFYKDEPLNTLTVSVYQDLLNDGMVLSVNDISAEGYDPMEDAVKMYGSPAAPQLFWIVEDTYISVNVRPGGEPGLELPVGLVAATSGEHLMTVAGVESFQNGEDLFLEDYLLNTTINLRTQSDYLFQATEGFDGDRFAIRIGNPAAAGMMNPESDFSISSEGSRIIVHGLGPADQNAAVRLYDLTGNLILAATINPDYPVIETGLPEGIYIIRLDTPTKRLSRKLFLNPASN